MKLQHLKNVSTLEFNPDICIGCAMCTEVCPHAVFAIDEKKARIIEKDGCMECGACARNCPLGAISVRAGVGCAYAIVQGKLKGTEPCCGESEDGKSGCCG